MKTYFYLLILSILMFSCIDNNPDEESIYNGIMVEDYILENYYDDAVQLYLEEIYTNEGHFNYNKHELQESEIQKILKIIQAVYNLDVPERDTVFNIHGIHGYYCNSYNSLTIKVDPSLPEMEKLSNDVIPTGNSTLDELLEKYDYDSTRTSYSYPDFPWMTIFFKGTYNMLPIGNEFEQLDGILDVSGFRGCVGDGNTIEVFRGRSSAKIVFSIGWGDCPAGCIHYRYWEFEVRNGMAKFLKSY
ncbi:hypothetical protein KZP23_16735 [Echinicola marina]|uniref:hypothetical protein n=1 Tax=Echinicola marina TaxID=2859768 RepID=UPI001CF63D21|nr:hypothetical protein [Echinicola marina]UCS92336.1 hypothetical protein KZP23_16735 [Echinicola marina]